MNILLLTGGRTGSSLLKSYLRQLGVGKPDAWLDKKFFSENYTLDEVHTFLETKRKKGILAVKASWWYFLEICDSLDIGMRELIDACFPNPKVVYMTRQDRVHQGLSRVKHEMLSKSHVRSDESMADYKTREAELLAVDVPVDAIKTQMLAVAYGRIAYEMFFKAHNIAPYRLAFEDFVADKIGTLRQLLTFFDVPFPEDVNLSDGYMSTHSEINERWHKEVLKEAYRII